jgi:hypothetical protein
MQCIRASGVDDVDVDLGSVGTKETREREGERERGRRVE